MFSISELCCMFCCPPCPGPIAAKLAFQPPEPTYKLTPSDDTNVKYNLHLFDRAEWQYSERDKSKVESFFTRTSRGNLITCVYVRCSRNAKYTLLFSHGNAVDLGQMSSFYISLGTQLNCNIFGYDYSGYGMSGGKPSEKNLYADIEAAWQALRNRHKTRLEFIRISAAVMGIEFSYAAETAFVSPTLLKIGIDHQHMTLVWALSPLIGFFACPFLGSLSDRCKLNLGRRRPFIIFLSIGVILGLLLIPNGEDLGYWFGDFRPASHTYTLNTTKQSMTTYSRILTSENKLRIAPHNSHPWGIFFTVLGTVLLDFDADACQSPARAYLLDICIPEDHVKGLSSFTIMAGLGGFMGYSMGGIDWDTTMIGKKLGGHIKTVFTLVTFIFTLCVTLTITSFKEIPLWILAETQYSKNKGEYVIDAHIGTVEDLDQMASDDERINSLDIEKPPDSPIESNGNSHGYESDEDMMTEKKRAQKSSVITPTVGPENIDTLPIQTVENLSHYLYTIIYMPHSLRMVCLTNLFCWMAHVCYSLYFTDFVGEAVFMGNPTALAGSLPQIQYEEGVRFGCWGMAMYSLSCACYSLIIEKLIKKLSAKVVYVGGLLFYSLGMTLMALTQAKASVIIFSWTAGVMYSTLFTMPYLLVAHYHSMGTFELDGCGSFNLASNVRGLGTDIAIVSSMVFLAQFILSLCMGTIVRISGTTTAVVSTASFLSFCGAITATKIMYLDL